MSKEKAEKFVAYLTDHPEFTEKIKGFTMEELKEAIDNSKRDGLLQSEDIVGGTY